AVSPGKMTVPLSGRTGSVWRVAIFFLEKRWHGRKVERWKRRTSAYHTELKGVCWRSTFPPFALSTPAPSHKLFQSLPEGLYAKPNFDLHGASGHGRQG